LENHTCNDKTAISPSICSKIICEYGSYCCFSFSFLSILLEGQDIGYMVSLEVYCKVLGFETTCMDWGSFLIITIINYLTYFIYQFLFCDISDVLILVCLCLLQYLQDYIIWQFSRHLLYLCCQLSKLMKLSVL
jgi:hypothetical protein